MCHITYSHNLEWIQDELNPNKDQLKFGFNLKSLAWASDEVIREIVEKLQKKIRIARDGKEKNWGKRKILQRRRKVIKENESTSYFPMIHWIRISLTQTQIKAPLTWV